MAVNQQKYALLYEKYKKEGKSHGEADSMAAKESEMSTKYPIVDYAKGTNVKEGQSSDVQQELERFTKPGKKKRQGSVMQAFARLRGKTRGKGRYATEAAAEEYIKSTAI